ncbi:MAG: hypothetical protein LW850_13275, partial [Planctomycetaceae bacterium]|nr:hypothetical protein [Planctomycetaceae bacterium]
MSHYASAKNRLGCANSSNQKVHGEKMLELLKRFAVQKDHVMLVLATSQRSFYRSFICVLSIILGSKITRVQKSRICYALATWIIIVGSLSDAQGGIVYNAVSEFSTGSNPNGSWSYRFSN